VKWTFLAVALLVLCCAACATVGQGPEDARLLEAHRAFDEAQKLEDTGRYAEAVPLAERALELREATLGVLHLEVARSLTLLGNLRLRQGAYSLTRPLYERALAIREQALGKDHPDVARSLLNLAVYYRVSGASAQAEPLAKRAITIQEAALGLEHPQLAAGLGHLAILYADQGLYAPAEQHYLRALHILEKATGDERPYIPVLLNGLATLYTDQGRYAEARPLCERALSLLEESLGRDHPEVATLLVNLASLHRAQGLYGAAEPLYQRALQIRQQALGERHPMVAFSLDQLAYLYHSMGLHERASPLYERALEINREVLGEGNLATVATINNLAYLYRDMGLYEQAERLYRRAIASHEKALGKSHPLYAIMLHNLAAIYEHQRRHAEAVSLHESALAILQEAHGPRHRAVAAVLDSLASIHRDMGLHERSMSLHERAREIKESTAGENHPGVADSYYFLALSQLAQHQLDKALPLLERALALYERHLRQGLLGLSEQRQKSFMGALRRFDESLYALVREQVNDERVRRLALTASLLHKGRSVEEAAATSLIISRGLGPADRELFERLRASRTQLSEKALASVGSLPRDAREKELRELADQGDKLEAELSLRSAPLRALSELPPPAEIMDRVAAALPGNGALVEMVAYEYTPSSTAAAQPAGELRYLALLLFADGHTRALDLGPAEPIDQALQELCGLLKGRADSYQPAAQRVYQLVFRPLLPALGKARRLFLSPDGQLALVPFDALHDGRRFLADRFDFTYLTSGKDLLPRPKDPAPAQSVVVLADPDFSAGPVEPSAEMASSKRAASVERLLSMPRTDLVDQPWPPLPGTRQEAEAIQRLLPQARLLLGGDATKDALLQLEAPGILHIATHGFFRGDAATPKGTRGIASSVSDMGLAVHVADPMLRSGLVLAGARASAASPDPGRLQRSLVAALELAGLDLWGTQLVVLSACDTGRGEVKLGQGVYGLRRALVVAGAQTVVTSLWKVDDQVTSELMEHYYRHLLAGQGRAAALRQAMRVLRRTHPHPHDWAPFIALGQDFPLQRSPHSPR
jgi:CHAT domain-containing protein/tetratricopeptide (TPR) repeat protein